MARDGAPYMGGVEPPEVCISQSDVVAAAKDAAARAAGYRESFAFGVDAPSEGRPKNANGQDLLTVTEVTNIANSVLAKHTFCVLGEVSELSNKPGYKAVYFTVKDEGAVMDCKMWRNRYNASAIELFIGAKVQITGRFNVYARTGRMTFDVTSIALEGEGVLRRRVAMLAQKLKAEGLMDSSRKRPLPAMPLTVGIITSPRGAVVHDALRTFRRRFPLAHIVFAGVPVEGANAAQDLIRALEEVGNSGAEVVLLMRGGGSFESFMPFNDEGLARAIANCPVPVVTGIGHEPDTSIADMVADHRASTPTDAALTVSPDRQELAQQIDALYGRMTRTLTNRLNRSVTYLDQVASRPLFCDPATLYAADAQSLDEYQGRLERIAQSLTPSHAEKLSTFAERLARVGKGLAKANGEGLDSYAQRLRAALPRALEASRVQALQLESQLRSSGATLATRSRHEVELANESLLRVGKGLLNRYCSEAAVATARLGDLSPLGTLERGWSIARTESGAVLKSVSQVHPNDLVQVQLKDGALNCRIEGETSSDLTELLSMEDGNE